MKKSFFAVLVSVTAVMGLSGCGGTVSSGGGGEGGSGNGGGGSGGGTTTTSGTTTGTTSGTTTDPATVCQDLCNAGLAAGCFTGDPAECIQGCNGTYTQFPMCTAELTAAYQCAIASVPVSGCEIDAACPDEVAAAQMCQSGGCGEGTCSGDGSSCSCDTTCNNVKRQVDCGTAPDGTIQCSCYEDSAMLGTCTGSDLSCDLSGGCCSQYWAL